MGGAALYFMILGALLVMILARPTIDHCALAPLIRLLSSVTGRRSVRSYPASVIL